MTGRTSVRERVTSPRIRVGISSCLLGQEVRWNAQHKRDAWLTEELAAHVEFVPVCPEVEVGLGVPREPIHLVAAPGAPKLVSQSGEDLTARMAKYAAERTRQLAALDLSGYVLKKDSPSCGMERVRVHLEGKAGPPRRDGVGAFARVLLERFPLLPVEEEGRLHDPALREGFVERLFAYARWKAAVAEGMTRAALIRFHAEHKLALLAHSPSAYRKLGALVGSLGRAGTREVVDAYGLGLMEALRVPATRGRHANVLQHAAGYFKKALPADDRKELEQLVREYQRGRTPLVVPLTLIRHHARKLGVEWLEQQTYLNPEPRELLLRNHV